MNGCLKIIGFIIIISIASITILNGLMSRNYFAFFIGVVLFWGYVIWALKKKKQ